MSAEAPGVWRWNVDPVWHHFSWMCQEAVIAKSAISTLSTYHHVSSCLYFGIGAIEAFLNQRMRKRFANIKTEAEIYALLSSRRISLMEKVEDWPSLLCGQQIRIHPEVLAAIDDFRKLRGEITHQKRHDHSLFSDLDATDPEVLVNAVRHYQVIVLQHLGEAFPYWLLGWNFIGLNNDPNTPCLLNNQHFRYSLRALGEQVSAADYYAAEKWERDHMSSWAGFLQLKTMLDGKNTDIEPFDDAFPFRPRLTRYWWDASLIKS